MKIKDLMEAPISKNLLYHGVRIEYAVEQLKNNSIEGHTNQRVWYDGLRRTEDDPEYQQSWTLSGLSATRDISIASGFGDVIYVFNRDKINDNYKIIPYNWGYHISKKLNSDSKNDDFERIRKASHKREKEEFIITGLTKRSFEQAREMWGELSEIESDEEYERLKAEMGDDLMAFMFPTKGALKPLDKFIEGIYFSSSNLDIHKKYSSEKLEYITNHPKFKGYIDKPKKKSQK
ncbi:hypothetical protein PBI_SCTP2_109 [Salicola phage SCTP-2]|nr:hypothetical protein PBI_SCTP2_109 [Salicola phage SCTP-2]